MIPLSDIMRILTTGNLEQQIQVVVQLREMLSIEKKPPIEEVIAGGFVPYLVTLLTANHSKLSFEAAWALTNIASGTTDQTRIVVEAGAIPHFVRLLQHPEEESREQAVWALANIAGDNPAFRDMILQIGGMPLVLGLFQPTAKLSLLRNATWSLSNLCRGTPKPNFELVAPCISTLVQLLYSADEEILVDACWALSYCSDGSDVDIDAIINGGACPRLVELLMHPSMEVKAPALRACGNVVTGNDKQTELIINCGLLPPLMSLLTTPKKYLRKEAAWTVSNITAGTDSQIQHVIDANLFPLVLECLSAGEFDVRKEAAWAIANACSGGNHHQIAYLVGLKCIPSLCELLDPKIDAKTIQVALDSISNILKSGAAITSKPSDNNPFVEQVEEYGLDQLTLLQDSPIKAIYESAVEILEQYFDYVRKPTRTNNPRGNPTSVHSRLKRNHRFLNN